MNPRHAAVCVITVDDGPGGRRWALVSIADDPRNERSEATRSRHTDPADVLIRVSQFLGDAGLEKDPDR